MSPPAAKPLFIEGPAGALEALVEEPDAAVATSVALVCHPHPLYGGTMENKVVATIARALREQGMATVRFNFRGVGHSAGKYDTGAGETADADVGVGHFFHGRLLEWSSSIGEALRSH